MSDEKRARNREYNRRYRERHMEKIRERQKQWERDQYAKNPEKHRAKVRAYYAANRTRVLAQKKARRQANPEVFYLRDKISTQVRRARQRGASVAQWVDRLRIYERDGGICHICHRRVSQKRFHLDHLVPLSQGGDHAPHNLAVAHPRCNMRRGAGRIPAQLRLPDELKPAKVKAA